jgi:hypothetical protein
MWAAAPADAALVAGIARNAVRLSSSVKFFDKLGPAVHAELREKIAAMGNRRMLAHPQPFRNLAA